MRRSLAASVARRALGGAPRRLHQLRVRPVKSSRTVQPRPLIFERPQWSSFAPLSSSVRFSPCQFRPFSESAAIGIEPTTTVSMTGTVTRIKFEDATDGFKVAYFEVDESKEEVIIVGNMRGLADGENATVSGHYGQHSKYGQHFKVISHQLCGGDLSAKVIADIAPGIGTALAKCIIEYADENDIDRHEFVCGKSGNLEDVEGIGKVKAQAIREAWTEESMLRDVTVLLARHNIHSQALCKRIVNRYAQQSLEVIQSDPYRLYREISGISFQKADTIAMATGIARDDYRRICAGILFALEEKFERLWGHTAVQKNDLVYRAEEVLNVNEEVVVRGLERLLTEQGVECTEVGGKHYVQRPSLAQAEKDIAAELSRVQQGPSFIKPSEVSKLVASAVKSAGFKLSKSQLDAVTTAFGNKMSVITGGPGTGKTALLLALVSALKEKKGASVKLTAFTGAAAKKLGNVVKCKAFTIHKLLGADGTGDFAHDEGNPLSADYVIVDEASMLSPWLLACLLRALASSCHLVLVGDVDQLPSIEPGAVLHDIIGSERFPVTRLDRIFRQGRGSSINEFAMHINNGDAILPKVVSKVEELDEGEDFQFLVASNDDDCAEKVLRVHHDFVRAGFGSNPICDTQILIPQYKGAVGINAINNLIQDKSLKSSLKPDYSRRKTFKIGDKVVQTKNDYELDLRNGNIGIVKEVNESKMLVEFDDEFHVQFDADGDDLLNLELAYALSVHKSQGSEYPAVIVVLTKSHSFSLYRKLLYTAVTRGKLKVVIIGDPEAYRMAVADINRKPRCTLLEHRLTTS